LERKTKSSRNVKAEANFISMRQSDIRNGAAWKREWTGRVKCWM